MREASQNPSSEMRPLCRRLQVPAGGGAICSLARGLRSQHQCDGEAPLPTARREGRMPGCPAPPSCAASWGRAPTSSRAVCTGPERGTEPRAAAAQPRCPLKKRRWRRALSPPGPGSPRTCEGLETRLDSGTRGKSGAGACASGRGRHPTCRRPAQVRAAQVRPRAGRGAVAGSQEPGAGRPALGSWAAAGRVPSGDPQGSGHLPPSVQTSP